MKIVALNGLLGYGYSEEALEQAFSEKVDYLGVDAGSTDPGPIIWAVVDPLPTAMR